MNVKLVNSGGLLYGKTHIFACKKKISSFANKQKGNLAFYLKSHTYITPQYTHIANPTIHKQHTKAPQTDTHSALRFSHQIHPSGGSRHIQHPTTTTY